MAHWLPAVLLAAAALALLGAMVARGESSLLFLGLFILLLPAGITAALLRWWPAAASDADGDARWRRATAFTGAGLLVAAVTTLALGLWWSGTAPGTVLLVAGIFLLPPAVLTGGTAALLGRRPRLPEQLEPGEEVVHQGRVHAAVFLPAALVLVAAAVLAIGPFGVTGYTAATVLYLLVLPGEGMRALLVYTCTEVLVTNRRLLLTAGLLRRRRLLIPREEIEAVGVGQRWPGTLLEYGKISIVCSDGDTRVLHAIEDPHELRHRLYGAGGRAARQVGGGLR